MNDKFIEEMYAPGEAKKKTINHHPGKRMWLIAAIITVMVFMMGCAIVYALKMENLWIRNTSMANAPANADRIHFFILLPPWDHR